MTYRINKGIAELRLRHKHIYEIIQDAFTHGQEGEKALRKMMDKGNNGTILKDMLKEIHTGIFVREASSKWLKNTKANVFT